MNILEEKTKDLDTIYPHTENKIKYIKEYVKLWLNVSVNTKVVKNINFIDCMCNAGIYQNGILGTPTEILKLFCEYAPYHQNIKFNLFVNDINEERITIIKAIFEEQTNYKEISNIYVYFSNKDVNEYIDTLANLDSYFNYEARAFTILFVDPYRFGDVKIRKLNSFLTKFRSELIYNYFISDYRRNINNNYAETKQQMMIESMKGIEGYSSDMDGDQLLEVLKKSFESTKISYTFAYPFHIKNNAQLYYILYGTPHIKGIEKIKECIWNVFDGNPKYRTKKDENQMTLFTSEFQQGSNENLYSREAIERVLNVFKGKEISYKELEEYVILNTMLNSSHIIRKIIRPLILEEKIEKCNIKGKSNYKEDRYIFQE